MFRTTWPLLRQTWTEFSADNATRLGAALAFYTALSLAPLLLIVIAIAGLAFGEEAARGELTGQMDELVGPDGAKTVNDLLASSTPKKGGVWAGVVGVVTLLVGAVGVFSQLQDSLNTVWNVTPDKAAGGVWATVRDKLLSFSMVCGMAFLLLVSLVLSAVLNALNGLLGRWLPAAVDYLAAGNLLLALLLTFAMFAMIFKVLPRVKVAWSDVWIGAGITTGLFAVGKYLIGLYLGHAAPGSTFGAAGSFVVLLLWLYYSSLILLFGAEFTQVYATRHGTQTHGVQPEEGAVVKPDPVPSPAF